MNAQSKQSFRKSEHHSYVEIQSEYEGYNVYTFRAILNMN